MEADCLRDLAAAVCTLGTVIELMPAALVARRVSTRLPQPDSNGSHRQLIWSIQQGFDGTVRELRSTCAHILSQPV
jgi:hypothetical protein